jgi:hypothetical protein
MNRSPSSSPSTQWPTGCDASLAVPGGRLERQRILIGSWNCAHRRRTLRRLVA